MNMPSTLGCYGKVPLLPWENEPVDLETMMDTAFRVLRGSMNELFHEGEVVRVVRPISCGPRTAKVIIPVGTKGVIAPRKAVPSNPESNWVRVRFDSVPQLTDSLIVRICDIETFSPL